MLCLKCLGNRKHILNGGINMKNFWLKVMIGSIICLIGKLLFDKFNNFFIPYWVGIITSIVFLVVSVNE